jgi:hypothetical protein
MPSTAASMRGVVPTALVAEFDAGRSLGTGPPRAAGNSGIEVVVPSGDAAFDRTRNERKN